MNPEQLSDAMNELLQKLLQETLAPSARLGLQTIVVGVGVGLLLGILAAMFKGTWLDYIIVFFSVLMISVPTLIFGLLLQKYVAGEMGLFPIIGWPSGEELWFGGWAYTVLPTLSGCFSYIATYSRLLKTSMLDVISQAQVIQLLQEIQQEREVGYLLISHDRALCERFCTAIRPLEGGRLGEPV